MNQEHQQNIYHASVNVSFLVEDVTWIKSGITISVGLSAKIQKNISAKKVLFGILQHVAAKMVNRQKVLMTQ